MAISKPAATRGGAEQILEITQSLGMARNIDDILLKLRTKIADVCQTERVTMFAFDSAKKELYSKVEADGGAVIEIRVPIAEKSIAGYTAKTGKIVNINDVYNAEEFKRYPGCSFDATWDKKSGFKTRSVLSVPLRYRETVKETVKDTGLQGVIQLVNLKTGGPFAPSDVELLKKVAQSLAIAFYNQRRIKKKPTKFSFILENDIISEDDLNKAITMARSEKDPYKADVPSLLVNDFGVSKKDMGRSLAQFYNTRFIEFDDETILPSELFRGLNENFLMSKFFVPFSIEEGVVTVIIDDPGNLHKIDEVRAIVPARDYRFAVSLREDITNYIDLATGKRSAATNFTDITDSLAADDIQVTEDKDSDQDMLNDDAPVIARMVNKIIQEAYEKGVSDIHVEPYPGTQPAQIRFRMDGACYKFTEIPSTHVKALVNRIKIMSKLKVDEKRMPQSGKIKLKYGNKTVELRVEVTPTVGGLEDVVMRILAAGKPLPLEKMNFSEHNLKYVYEVSEKPYGLILVVGPTGSGKTTTLHSILGHLNKADRKIWTAEDPVEITQYGLRQVQVNPNIKPIPFDFALAMRSFLRADPDIIMVGEMRDKETASMGVEASLTGHLVLSTLHTNSAPETITRLVDMGLNPINFADSLLGILAQRLVRTLCPKCKEGYTPTEEDFNFIVEEYGREAFERDVKITSTEGLTLYKAKGCDSCDGGGYKGRTGLHELLVGTAEMKKLIMKQAVVEKLRSTAMEQGMRTLKMDGIQKVFTGQCDMDMVRRVCIE